MYSINEVTINHINHLTAQIQDTESNTFYLKLSVF
jgi:hypothetical protein